MKKIFKNIGNRYGFRYKMEGKFVWYMTVKTEKEMESLKRVLEQGDEQPIKFANIKYKMLAF